MPAQKQAYPIHFSSSSHNIRPSTSDRARSSLKLSGRPQIPTLTTTLSFLPHISLLSLLPNPAHPPSPSPTPPALLPWAPHKRKPPPHRRKPQQHSPVPPPPQQLVHHAPNASPQQIPHKDTYGQDSVDPAPRLVVNSIRHVPRHDLEEGERGVVKRRLHYWGGEGQRAERGTDGDGGSGILPSWLLGRGGDGSGAGR